MTRRNFYWKSMPDWMLPPKRKFFIAIGWNPGKASSHSPLTATKSYNLPCAMMRRAIKRLFAPLQCIWTKEAATIIFWDTETPTGMGSGRPPA